MEQTITEKIFSVAANRKLSGGDIVEVNVDLVIVNDITAPISIEAFKKSGVKKIYNADSFCIVMDHLIPNKDIASANQSKISRDFAKKHKLKNFFDEKDMGIEHSLLAEKGLISPGDIVIGADSHTCTHGALGAFSTGMGSTDIAFTMATGKNWFKVPKSIKVVYTGKLGEYVGGKDLILELIRRIGVSGATYKALEFCGDTIEELNMDSRFSLCNMSIEAGAKSGIVAPDNITKDFIKHKNIKLKRPTYLKSDYGASYDMVLEIDVGSLEPLVAYPHLPSNGKSITKAVRDNIKVDQVFIGTCTNGRLSDIKQAADILKGNKVAQNTRLIVTPATQEILKMAISKGYINTLIDSGAVVSNPTCGACFGGYMGILGKNEVCLSTANRNFLGRMGDKGSQIYLANSAIAAATAIRGKIADPRNL